MVSKEKIVSIIETKSISLNGFTFIEGFPDLGLAGTIAARYLVDKLKFEQIGYVDSEYFLPIIRIQNGLPTHPVRIYANKKNKVVIALAEQIIVNEIAYPMTRTLIDWIKKKGITRVISTSGVRIPDGKTIYAFASNEASKKIIKDNKIDLIENGITSGVTALLMLGLKDNNIEAFCLLGNAHSNTDYTAAAEVVRAMCKFTGLCVDVKPLLNEAKALEGMLMQHLKSISTASEKETKIDSTPMFT